MAKVRWDWEGDRILVTGGTQGIGAAIARGFVAGGGDVHVCGTRASLGDYDDPPVGVTYHQADLGNAEARVALRAAVGDLDILVNNASIPGGVFDEFEMSGFEKILEVDLMAIVDLSYRFYDTLKMRGGSIVNVGSLAAFHGLDFAPAYTAAKHGLLGFTRALAAKWAVDGIRVNMIAPGFTATRQTAPYAADPEVRADVLKRIPMNRMGEPHEQAAAVFFLASSEASYITGQAILIDGGRTGG